MKEIEKTTHYNILFDFYNSLLTEKQKEYFLMYFSEDYSLKEIADYYNVTRNAIFSALTTTMSKLEEYESKLKLYKKNKLRKEYYSKYQESKDSKWLIKIMEVED